jgi:hypothetical protein
MMISPSEAYLEDLAARVAAKVIAELKRAPVIQPRLLTVEQAAVVLGRSEKAVRHLLTSGHLKNASPDARVQVDTVDIDLLIANSKKK